MAVRSQASGRAAARRGGVAAASSRRLRAPAAVDFRLIQRDRIMFALAETVEQFGVRALNVSEIVARAGVSRRTFYEQFADCDQALAATIEEGLARAAASVVPAYRGEPDWLRAMRAGTAGLLAFLEQEPAFGSLVLLDALAGPLCEVPGLLVRRAHVARALVDAIDAGRGLARSAAGLSRANAEAVLGGALFIVRARMLERRERAMRGLPSELMSVIVRPYIGAAAAEREARRPAPVRSRHVEKDRDGAPLGKVGVRLTMRTVLVLRQIAEHPGSSNRQVATLAEISDQGQTSKLLTRLAGAGLIENAEARSPAGMPNAWRLTAAGRGLVRALSSGPRGHI